jgi:hypothetical protein
MWRGQCQTISERYLTSIHRQLMLRLIPRQPHNEVRGRLESVWMYHSHMQCIPRSSM